MKSVSVRDLRNSCARIEPAAPVKTKPVVMPDFLARLREDFGDYVVPEGIIEEGLEDSRAGYDERRP